MKNYKRLIAVLSATSVLLSGLFLTQPMFLAAEEGTGTEDYISEVIFESGYDGASKAGSGTIFTKHNSDMYPASDPAVAANTVIKCRKSWTDRSYLYLGADYKTQSPSDVDAQSISVKAGDTFEIEFKYKLEDNENQPKNPSFQLGVCTTVPATYSVSGNNTYCTNKKVILDSSATATDGWQTAKVTYTVGTIDKTSDDTFIDKLTVFAIFSAGRIIYIDDVKVTSAGKYTGEVLADEDYSDSSAGCDKKTSFFSKASNDITPVYDPSDTSNKVIQCIKSRSNYSHLYLGADYVIPGFYGTSGNWQESQNRVATQSITVEPGQKYYIKFKYKLTKGAGTTEPNFFDLGIGTITHNTYGENGSTLDKWGNNKNYDNVSNFITKDTAAVTEGWQTYETFYTAESINKTSDGVAKDKLAIICKIANNYYNIYFDDVKVIKLAEESSDVVIYDTEFADATIRSGQGNGQDEVFGDA